MVLRSIGMNPAKQPKSFQEILKQRQQSSFVGREGQVALFRLNLEFRPEDERRRFLFNVWGQGGVGKTTLLGQFRAIVEKAQGITAYIDEGEREVPEIMARLAADLEKQGQKLTQFSERYRVYRQKREELEADPEAPQGFSAFLGRTIAKSAVKLGRQVPGAGMALEFVNEEAVANQAGEWTAYLTKKLTNKDEVHLLKEPVEVLTPLFLQEWGRVAEKIQVALIFDTYEVTGEALDEWLRDVLQGRYGNFPSNFLWVIAGREELDQNRWAEYEGVLVRLPLEPFSEAEARHYLERKGVTDDRTIAVILNLSGRLPLLVAMLAEGSPNDPEQVGDPSGTAVERFLKWETDAARRQVALDAALPRCLNQDVIAQLGAEAGAAELFEWLKQKPFVRERTDGWAYHEVVRTQMLRSKRLISPQGWAELHGKLADYYDAQRQALQLDAEQCQRDATWQTQTLHVLYHRLCQVPQKHLPVALNEFLAALKNQRKFAEQWAETMTQAGKDTSAAEVQRWGDQLVEGLKAYNEDRYEVTLAMFKSLVDRPEIEPQWQPIARGWRGETYRLMKRYEEALQDFNYAIELDPKYAWAIALRGETYRLMNRYEEALQDFDRAIELDPKSAWKIASRGQTYQAMKRYEEALQDFDRAIELDPKDAWAIASRGKTYRLMNRYEEALQDFDRAIELDPKDAGAIARRGQTYRLMNRYEEALQDFDRAIELDPKDAWAIALRGETYRLMNRYEEALQDFDRAIELDPKYSWAIANRGQTYRDMKRYEEALQDFDRAIELDPKSAWAIRQRGEVYLLTGNYQDALADFDRGVELDAENDWYLYDRALAYQASRQPELARTDLAQAIRLAQAKYEKDPEGWYSTFNLALYHLAVGENKPAEHFYRDAIRRNAPTAMIQMAIQDLADFLTVFPNHRLARAAHQFLQNECQKRSATA
jgi:tetratricopeptide (TPR) repeat protein